MIEPTTDPARAADEGRAQLVLADRGASRGTVPRDVWLIVTTSYRLDVDPASPGGRDRRDAVSRGDVETAARLGEARYRVADFRTALDARFAN